MCDIFLSDRPLPSYKLRLGAFFAALIVAPWLGSTLAFYLAPVVATVYPDAIALSIVAAFAPIVGIQTYILYGAPIFALLVLVCHGGTLMGAAAGTLAIWIATQFGDPSGATASIGWFFAPLWGATFGFVYRRLALSGA